jgi:ABC-type lipoprotein export system ATPase subunit
MNTKGKLYFIIGASGSGKTTIVKTLENNYPNTYKIVYFDSIGVPSVTEMKAKYNGPEEWQSKDLLCSIDRL